MDEPELRDKKGYKWYKRASETETRIDLNDAQSGEFAVLRNWKLEYPPGMPVPTDPQEVWKHHGKYIKDQCYETGLTSDDRFPFPYDMVKDKQDPRVWWIFAYLRPSKHSTHENIWAGMRATGNETTERRAGKHVIQGAKIENVGKLLVDHAKTLDKKSQ